MNCPKCSTAMDPLIFTDRKIYCCSSCLGTAIFQIDLEHILNGIYCKLKDHFGPQIAIQPLADKVKSALCPGCAQAMSRHGYMGSNHVIIDVCAVCGIVFLDRDELCVMAMLYSQYVNESERILRLSSSMPNNISARMMMNHIF